MFAIASEGPQTRITWSMTGCTIFNMDKMVGGEFAKGLASLKALVEAEPAKRTIAA